MNVWMISYVLTRLPCLLTRFYFAGEEKEKNMKLIYDVQDKPNFKENIVFAFQQMIAHPAFRKPARRHLRRGPKLLRHQIDQDDTGGRVIATDQVD